MRSYILAALLLLGLSSTLLSPGWAQTGSPIPTASVTPDSRQAMEGLQERLEEVELALRSTSVPSSEETIGTAGGPPYYTSLLRIEASLRRLISLRETDGLLDVQIARVEAETVELTQQGLKEQRPYPLTLLDELQFDLMRAQEQVASQTTAVGSAQADVKMQSAQLESQNALRRRLLDQRARTKDVDLELDRALENATWAAKAGEVALEVSEADVASAKKAQLLAEKRQQLLERKVELVSDHFQFTKPLLEEQLDLLDEQRISLTAQQKQAQSEAAEALEKVKALQSSSADDSPPAQAELEAQTEWLTTHQRHKILLEQALELNLTRRDLWERRYDLNQGQGLVNLSDWEESTRGLVRRLENGRETLDSQLGELRGRMASVVEASPENGSSTENWKNSQAKALAAHQKALEAGLAEYGQTFVLAQRLLSEIQTSQKGLTWKERAVRVWAMVVNLWQVELYTIGDSSVTIGKIIVAFLVLIVGLTLVGRGTSFVSHRLLSHLPMPDAVRGNIERFVRYFMILLVFLFALRVVNIPLTIFTFLGGTLAIAVGFGAQNILNNFISGLILMAERPVSVGDLIEVDQTTGVVEEIGARSTRVRMGTGIHVVLPNSVLLENKVVNWTLGGQTVRSSVSVGVAYGSDPEVVMNLLSRATLALESIEKTPSHFVMLEDLADSSMLFTVHFWVSIADPLNKRRSESNLRLGIVKLFEQHEIAIPFPQRELSIVAPVQVQMVDDTEKRGPQT